MVRSGSLARHGGGARLLCAEVLAVALAGCSHPPPCPYLPGHSVPATLNGRPLPHVPPGGSLRLLLLGHLYGDPRSSAPLASTFLAARSRLADADADLWYCLGDTFRAFHPDSVAPVLQALQGVPVPVCNAPGNHDLTDRPGYLARFGPAYGAFALGPALLVQVDTEEQPWEIRGDQLGFLRRVVERAAADPQVRVLIVLGHKLVFSHRKRYLELLAGANGRDGLAAPNRFATDVLPLLDRLRSDQQTLWCAGDVGAPHSLPLFCERDADRPVTWLATGVGDTGRDLALLVDVAPDGTVELRALSLTGRPPADVEAYGIAHWCATLFPDGLPAAVEALRARLPD